MAELPLVTIIVLNYNGRGMLQWCLPSILKTDYPNYELLLVDNASSDDSVEFVRKRYPSIRIIVNEENLGFAEGNNRGIRLARGKYIALLNNDVLVEPEWLIELVRIAEQKTQVGALAPKIMALKVDTANQPVQKTRLIYNTASCQDIVGFAYSRGDAHIDRGQYDDVEEVLAACGICMVSRKALRTVGFFDSTFFFSHEDIDLSWRMRLAGFKVYYVPTSIIHHRWGTRGKTLRMFNALYHEERNRLTTLMKLYSGFSLAIQLPRYFVLKVIQVAYLLIMNQPFARTVLSAIFASIKGLRRTLSQRMMVKSFRRVPDKEVTRFMTPYSVELASFFSPSSGRFMTSLIREGKVSR
ncbi:MAG: glycosyltransferase family 2 protein [Candidatus Thorarchaeota archaeon]